MTNPLSISPPVAVFLMSLGVLPSLAIVVLLYDDRHKPGVLWFIVSMGIAGLWALTYAGMTAVQSPAITLALANVFWAMVPAAAVAMFLLAYEYVFREVASRRLVAALFAPVVVLFVLSWTNPWNLVFTPAYQVNDAGILQIPPLDGPVKILVTKVYGYLLATLAAGMFVGEALRSSGLRRRQTLYLLLTFAVLAGTPLVKILGFVPEYYDPTATAFSVSGLVFAYSIDRTGLMKFVPIAREQAFEAVDEIIVVVDPSGAVVDVNHFDHGFFGTEILGTQLSDALPEPSTDATEDDVPTVTLQGADGTRHFSWQSSAIAYGRGLNGTLVVLSDITTLTKRQEDLHLLKQILTRIFRHNMRNDLNVIEGYAAQIPESTADERCEIATTIRERAAHLQSDAAKAHEIERVFEDHEPERVALADVVDRVLVEYRDDADVSVTTAVDDVTVAVHPQFGVALAELVENATVHHAGPTPVEISVSTTTAEDRVVLTVADDGPGIPSTERDVIASNEETSLHHSSGIGLWLVKLVVTRADGELDIDADDTGTRVELSLPRASREQNRT